MISNICDEKATETGRKNIVFKKSIKATCSMILICFFSLAFLGTFLGIPVTTEVAKAETISKTATVANSDSKNNKTIKVAMLGYPNFLDKNSNGKLEGYAYEYLKEIAKHTGWKYEYIPMSFAEAESALASGKIDIVPGSQYTQERAAKYDFGKFYMTTNSNVLCVKADNEEYYYNDYKALDGKKIGVMKGSIREVQLEETLKENDSQVKYIEYENDEDQQAALMENKVDAILLASIRITSEYKVIASDNVSYVYFTTNPKDPSIKKELDMAQEEVLARNPGYSEELYNKCYAEVSLAYAFSEEERKQLKKQKTLTVAIIPDLIPYEYYDKNKKEYDGFTVDYFNKISEITGLKFKFVKRGSTVKTAKDLESGKIQIIASVATGSNEDNIFDVTTTDPYYGINAIIAYHKSVEDSYDTSCIVAVNNDFFQYEQLAKQEGYKNIVRCDSFKECVNAVNSGKADVTLLPEYAADTLLNHAYYTNIKTSGTSFSEFECAVGVSNKCDPMVISVMNKAISSISSKEKNDLMANSIANSPESNTFKDILAENVKTIFVVIIIALIIVITFVVRRNYRRKIINEKLARAKKTAESASEAKTDFLSRISHDMRTPMNGILGLANLSKNENQVEVLKENIKKIEESGEYLLCLINDTLDFQKIESGNFELKLEVVQLRQVINNIMDMVRGTAEEKNINLQFVNKNIDMDSYIKIDPLRMKQVFVNLLSNALKFTPPGGTVIFSIERVSRKKEISYLKIRVKDTGVGMSKEFLENKIFQPFSQEKNVISNQYTGSGLGLSIVKKIVELTGNSIEVESKLNEGTTFTILLTAKLFDSTEATNYEEQEKEAGTKAKVILEGKKILLVEDHPLNAEISEKLLEKVGCKIVWAKNGKEAVEIFENSMDFDAILMDIRMPVMDGVEATATIRGIDNPKAKQIPIIAMTANAYASDIKKSLEVGMNAHLAKPINPKEMYNTLLKFL